MELSTPSTPPVPDSDSLAIELRPGWTGPDAAPLEIDIGCHKGTFLVAMAERFPERNFLGVERQTSRVDRCMAKIRRLGLANADVVCREALPAVRDALPPGVADVIHVLFPDPWPKRRHHVRRLVQEDFLQSCRRLLKPGGLLRIVTDDPAYADAIRQSTGETQGFEVSPITDLSDYPETEFQKKFQLVQKPFGGVALRKIS